MEKYLELFASLFPQNGDAENKTAHHAQTAAAFSAAVQVIEASLGEGVDLEAELRARAQNLNDMADLVKAAKEAKTQ